MSDLEANGARLIIVPLRHPLERVASGIARRFDVADQQSHYFKSVFNGSVGHVRNRFVSALRNASDPLHEAAVGLTFLTPVDAHHKVPPRQFWLIPISFYLDSAANDSATLAFVCTDSLSVDLIALAKRWNLGSAALAAAGWHLNTEQGNQTRHHQHLGDQTLFSVTNARYLEDVYAEDVELYNRHCKANGHQRSPTRAPSPNPSTTLALSQSSLRLGIPCVGFLHVVKSGGQTIKLSLRAATAARMLLPMSKGEAHICTCEGRVGQCATHLIGKGGRCDMLMGTNVLQVRQQAAQCKWATFVRDPVATLVSSLHYCRHPEEHVLHDPAYTLDQLCGSALDARNATVRQWAAFRRAPLFWALALDPRFGAHMGAPLTASPLVNDGVWSLQAAVHRDDAATHAAAYEMAAAITNGSMFDVIGLVEEWTLSMHAFDAALPLTAPVNAKHGQHRLMHWANWSARHTDRHGSESWAAEERRDLEDARRDPLIAELLSLDRMLYAAFVTAFQRQRDRLN